MMKNPPADTPYTHTFSLPSVGRRGKRTDVEEERIKNFILKIHEVVRDQF